MKNIKKRIKEDYHNVQLNEIKNKIDLNSESVSVTKRTKFLIPSMAALVGTIVLVIVFMSLFPKQGKSSPNSNAVLEKLKENTSYYIDVPIKRIDDQNSGLTIYLYYGIIENEFNEYNNYIIISYESSTKVSIDTKVNGFSEDFDVDGNLEKVIIFNELIDLSVKTIQQLTIETNDILIEFISEDFEYSLEINLEDYYNLLLK